MIIKKTNIIQIILLFLTIIFYSCTDTSLNKLRDKFLGAWIDPEHESVIIIERSGFDYIVNIKNNRYPATRKGNTLEIDKIGQLMYDNITGHMLISGIEYNRMTGDMFTGTWKLVEYRYSDYGHDFESFLQISRDSDNTYFTIIYKTELEAYKENNIKAEFVNGRLIGDYYGAEENVKIEVVSSDKIKFSIDPYGEFTPVKDEIYKATETMFIPKSGNDFIGVWEDTWKLSDNSKGKLTIDITGAGNNYYDVTMKFEMYNTKDWRWRTRFTNQSLYSTHSVNGKRPTIILIDANTLKLKDFFLMRKSEHTLIRKNKVSITNRLNAMGKLIGTDPCYIINVSVASSLEKTVSKVEELKSQGYNAGYLWIPDYASLSGAKLYAIFIGPFETQKECEIAVEKYRQKQPSAYGVLVSQENNRVEIRGIDKVKITENYNKKLAE